MRMDRIDRMLMPLTQPSRGEDAADPSAANLPTNDDTRVASAAGFTFARSVPR
jgi:hypothetical protein